MNSRSRLARTVRYGSVVCGVFILYWGLVSIASAPSVPSFTVPWLDQALTDSSRFVWLPAAGVLLVVVGVSPAISPYARSSRIVRTLVGVFGLGFLCLGGFFMILTLSPIWGFVYVAPLIVTGLVLLVVSLDVRKHGAQELFSS